jgi:hypothetical protein
MNKDENDLVVFEGYMVSCLKYEISEKYILLLLDVLF